MGNDARLWRDVERRNRKKRGLDPLRSTRGLRFKTNRAALRIVYPDGCRHAMVTDATGKITTDAVTFAKWLIATGEELLERSTTKGQCAKR